MRLRLFLTAAALAGLLSGGCRPSTPPPSDGGSEVAPSPAAPRPTPLAQARRGDPPLASLHQACMEMGLDAFQFARPRVGWPADLGPSSAAAFLQAAQNANYLTPDEMKKLQSVRIANVSDNDLLNTRLLEWKRSDGSLVVVRKDGTSGEFASPADADAFAPLPARDPVWLP